MGCTRLCLVNFHEQLQADMPEKKAEQTLYIRENEPSENLQIAV